MAEAQTDLAGLAQIHRLDDPAEVRALWRRGMATLAAVASEHQPVPLEGFSPSALLAGARIALSTGLFDQLDWLSPAAASVAMFELASALPRSEEKRELGRRVLTALHQGDAETFVALATALTLGSSRTLGGPQIRARVALSLYLPIGLGTRADSLALALLSRRDSEREWLSVPSTGSLPARRLAARLIERAAREAARRFTVGDDSGVHVFTKPTVASAFRRLLADRESLVWRHVAAARGLLSNAIPSYQSAIERALAPELSPTEWRRAAASMAARLALTPEETLTRCSQILHSDILARDRGVVAAMIFGLPCAADTEREAAEELLDLLIDEGDIFAIEALVDLRGERLGSEFGARAAMRAQALLREDRRTSDDGMEALKEALYDDLAPAELRMGQRGAGQAGLPGLHDRLIAAIQAFASGGALAAKAATDAALEAALDNLARLERAGGDTNLDRIQAFRAMRELDRGILETTTLSDLLTIRAHQDDAVSPLERLRGRLTAWLLSREAEPVRSAQIDHLLWRLRRLRTLLHVIDADGAGADERKLRERRLRTLSVLTTRVSEDVPSALRRTVCAALARACDAVVREDICELSDMFLVAVMTVEGDADLSILAEASMAPAFKSLIRVYVDLRKAVHSTRAEAPGSSVETCLEMLRTLIHTVPTAESPRIEALRSALGRFHMALGLVHGARALSDLSAGSERLAKLETATQWLAQLVIGACRRLDRNAGVHEPQVGTTLRNLEAAAERAARGEGGTAADTGQTAASGAAAEPLADALAAVTRSLRAELPMALAEVAELVLGRIPALPQEAPADHGGMAAVLEERPRMAPWLPPGRTLGGFYILRTIGKGAVGSVFVARRVEERHDESAETFALKVPEYNGAAAHTLSEAEFLRLFREEARALLALPEHPNLARFVTFDAGARPKPILVMELVPGPTLERMLEREEFDVAQALDILDGIAAGLGAMHRVGVAHLDVKPSNIILREGPGGKAMPVLVDFGLAGRKIRPGCATVHYGAPEVWSTVPRPDLEPMPTDVYAFTCLAFEVLTNEVLFDGDTAVSVVSAHLKHKGRPPGLDALARNARLAPLAELLSTGLRPESPGRITIDEMRERLAELAVELADMPWPLVLDRAS